VTPEERHTLEEQILNRLRELEVDIERLEELTQPIAPENSMGRVSRMDAINNKSVTEAALRQSRLRKTALEQALQRLDDSDFGLCERCKNPIPTGRLLLVPESARCVHCASR